MIVENIQAIHFFIEWCSFERVSYNKNNINAMTHAFTMNLLVNMLLHPVKSFQSDTLSNRNVAVTIPIHCLKRDYK
jgi:hypothetical protein